MAQVAASTSSLAQAGSVARASTNPPEQVRRTERQVQTQAAEGRLQDELAGRVERLVQRMEAVASRITAEGTSTSRRAVLVTRYNELQRQVNELDGIVVAEGQETQAQKQVSGASAAGRTSRARLGRTRPQASATSAPARRVRRQEPDRSAAPVPTGASAAAETSKRAAAPRKTGAGNTTAPATPPVDLMA